ncbi:MAG: GNAT family N-acetyltransferase [Alphaproteobacteria bacterium]
MIPDLFGPRLHLRAATADDIEAVHMLLIDPQVRRYLCDGEVFTHAQVAALYAEAEPHRPRELGWWIVERADDMIGMVALLPVSETAVEHVPELAGEIEPTVALWPQSWGQGFAAEALAALHAHAFDTLDLPGLVAMTDEPNSASQAMLTRAGYVKTGESTGPAWPTWTYRLDRT